MSIKRRMALQILFLCNLHWKYQIKSLQKHFYKNCVQLHLQHSVLYFSLSLNDGRWFGCKFKTNVSCVCICNVCCKNCIDDLLGLRQLISGGVDLKTLAPKVVGIALLIKDCYLLLMMLLLLGSVILHRLPFVIIMSNYFS